MQHGRKHQDHISSLNYFLVLTLCLNNICDYVRQRTVVTYRASEYKRYIALYAFIHHSPFQELFFNQCLNSSSFENLVDACIWLRCPLTASVPSLTRMPSEVPSNAFSTS